MPPKRRQAEDTSDAEPQYTKKSKGNTGKAQPQELTKGSDQDGNTFWEVRSPSNNLDTVHELKLT